MNNKRRICFLMYNLFGLGGIQRVVSILASELCKYHEVYIQCYDDPKDENRALYNLSDHVNIVYVKRQHKSSVGRKLLRKLNQKYGLIQKIHNEKLFEYAYLLPEEQKIYKKVLTENHIDIAIAVGAYESYMLGSVAQELKCRTIGWQHNSYKAYFETPGMACWGMGYIIDKYYPMLDRYVVLNEYDEMEFLNKRNMKCTTIHNPKSFVSDKKADLKNKRFIAAGRLIYAKGFDLLIESFRLFAEKNSDWTLTIYGTGDCIDQLKNKLHEYGLEDRVFLPGFSSTMMNNLLESSVYLLSSRWEGMPMVLLESLEVGLPIITYDISAVLPLVDNGVEGIVVPQFDYIRFADAMIELAQNNEMRNSMGVSAQNKAQLFSVERITEKWIDLFDNI